ncbi:MAG: succinyldiaminopimelate transaminase [Corticimicrobacter sp.]|uniref:succinyldiaminopimelate transaminase n=1 Tax=Corticimicrobacter sp. TaxID=2678536 RepID=UPI0032DBA72D
MNPRLQQLAPYPFEKLRALLGTAELPPGLRPVNLSIGEPKHAAPQLVRDAMANSLDGLSVYPPTKGEPALRTAIADWLAQRYPIPRPDPDSQILPVLGTREALFSFVQTIISPSPAGALVICPNPFYQIYEGAALLAGAQPWFINSDPARNFSPDWSTVPDDVWARTQLVFVCSPGNPAGNVMTLDEWQYLFEQSDRHGFVIAADECYSEIYFDETAPPLGALQAAQRLGRSDYRNLVSFSSLSKRSNVPGLRSGFVAGDARLLEAYLLYRTYHCGGMSQVVSRASIAAWSDETHVRANRRLYAEKFAAVLPILSPVLDVALPDASFYLWAGVAGDDVAFARELYASTAVTVLPGSYLAREAHGLNPGAGRIRIALVAPVADCIEAAHRIAAFVASRPSTC